MKQFINNFLAKNNILIRKLLPRPAVLFAKEHFKGKPVMVCEIGTYKGYNAKSIFNTLNVSKMACIDPYIPYDNSQLSGELVRRAELRKNQVLYSQMDRIVFLHMKSIDASRILPMFDFIYLDGDHRYENVKAELEAYWQLLSRNGILAGHDIDDEGVFKAVGEFSIKNNLRLHLRFPDWWIVKPSKGVD